MVQIEAGNFEVVFEQLEQRIEGSTKKIEASLVHMTSTLETHFKRLETKLNIAGDELAALTAQFKETGNSLGRFVEAIGKYTGIGPIEGAGAMISLAPGDSDDQKAFSEFFKQAPSQLLERVEILERDIASLGTDPDQDRAKKAIDKMRREQELILTALINQGGVFRTKVDELARLNPNSVVSGKSQAFLDNKQSLKIIRNVLDAIREFATSPELQRLIDGSRAILDPSSRQTGALATSPQALQLANAGGVFGGAGSDSLRDTLRELGVTTGDTEGSFTELNDEMDRYQAVVRSLASGLVDTNVLFGTQTERLRGLGALLPDIGRQLIDVFDAGTEGATELDRSVAALGERFLDAFEGAIRRGESLGDVLKSLARDLAELALQAVKSGDLFGGGGSSGGGGGGLFGSLLGSLGGLFGGGGGGLGAGISPTGSDIFGTPFARGGAFTNRIVDRPTLFPMADGMGLMGEAGPEAVMPLTRLPNGELGIKGLGAGAAPAGPVNNYYIDARGADREGLSRLAAVVRQQGAQINHLDRTMDRRAVNAVAWRRSRGPFR